jgi:hypothetical protein
LRKSLIDRMAQHQPRQSKRKRNPGGAFHRTSSTTTG